MSTDIATITITGRLGGDPELKEKFASFSVASNYWNGKEGAASWFRVKDFRAGFDKRAGFLSKGSRVTVSGDLSVQEWVDKEGNKRTSVEIAASHVVLPPKSQSPDEIKTQAKPKVGLTTPDPDEEIPFS